MKVGLISVLHTTKKISHCEWHLYGEGVSAEFITEAMLRFGCAIVRYNDALITWQTECGYVGLRLLVTECWELTYNYHLLITILQKE